MRESILWERNWPAQSSSGIAESRILISWVSPKGGLTKPSTLARASEPKGFLPSGCHHASFQSHGGYNWSGVLSHWTARFLSGLQTAPGKQSQVATNELIRCTSSLLAFSAEVKIQNPRMLHRMRSWSSINTKELFTPLPIAGITTRAQFSFLLNWDSFWKHFYFLLL